MKKKDNFVGDPNKTWNKPISDVFLDLTAFFTSEMSFDFTYGSVNCRKLMKVAFHFPLI